MSIKDEMPFVYSIVGNSIDSPSYVLPSRLVSSITDVIHQVDVAGRPVDKDYGNHIRTNMVVSYPAVIDTGFDLTAEVSETVGESLAIVEKQSGLNVDVASGSVNLNWIIKAFRVYRLGAQTEDCRLAPDIQIPLLNLLSYQGWESSPEYKSVVEFIDNSECAYEKPELFLHMRFNFPVLKQAESDSV